MSPEPENRSLSEVIADNRRAVILGVVAAAALIAACAIAFILIRPFGESDGGKSGVTTGEDIGTPTPFPTLESLPEGISSNGALVVGISDSDTISVSLDIPASLSVAGQQFPIRAETVSEDGNWQPDIEGNRTAVWVYGTIINYVVALPDTSGNQALLNQLAPGEEIVLTTRGGMDNTFKFSDRKMVASTDSGIFSQHVPGLTIVLVGGDAEDRMVVQGRYVVPEAGSGRQSPVVELGETTQLEDLQVTVTGATYLLDRPESPAGFAFFMVDYQVQNIGLTAFDTNRLQLLLLDELGNQYALSPASRQLGNHPPLSGFLNSNQVIEATAGYQIPIGLNSSALTWVVTRGDTGAQVHVAIPFQGGGAAGAGTDVRLLQAEVSPDLTSLILTGQITNLGDQPILVSEQQVSLKTGDGSVYLLLATNPPFPWTVSGNQSVQFQVTFQRPLSADVAVFTVLNQPYELRGLR